MKYFKFLLVSLVVTSAMAISGVSAAAYRNYAAFKIPAFQGTVNAGSATKSDYERHVIAVLSTTDRRDIQVRLTGEGISGLVGTSPWVTVVVDQNTTSGEYTTVKKFSTETSSEAYGMVPGEVTLTMRAKNIYVNGTNFSGTWFSSEDLYNKVA